MKKIRLSLLKLIVRMCNIALTDHSDGVDQSEKNEMIAVKNKCLADIRRIEEGAK